MEYTQLEDLEAKVSKVMERINTLRTDNEELKKSNRDLENKFVDMEKTL